MQSSPIDIKFDESKNTLIVIYEQSSDFKQTLKFYETPKFNKQQLFYKINNPLKQQEIPIKQFKNIDNSYLNVSRGSNKKIDSRDFINKYIVDNDIVFKSMNNIYHIIILYCIKLDSFNNIIDFKYSLDNGESFKTCPDNTDLQEFIQDFIEVLQKKNTQGLVYLIGFGHSLGVVNNRLPIQILFQDLLTLLYKYNVKTWESDYCYQATSIQNEGFERVYLLDLKLLTYQYMQNTRRSQPQDNTVQSYVLFIADKHGQDFCLNETLGIAQLLNSINQLNVFGQIHSFVALLNVPLSYALYETKVTSLMLRTFQLYFKSGYAFTYRILDVDEQETDESNNGGIFETVPVDQQYLPQYYVMEADFFSMYPSIITLYNISPEMIVQVDQEQTLKLQVNYPKEDLVYMQQHNKGIFPQIVDFLLTKRQELPKTDPQYAQVKRLLVSVYGMLGMKMSPFYNKQCQRVTCSLGRKACDAAKQALIQIPSIGAKGILARFTDSCQFKCTQVPKKGQSINDIIKVLIDSWDIVDTYISDVMGDPQRILRLNLQSQVALIQIYSHQVNSSLKLVFDHETLKEGAVDYKVKDAKKLLKNNKVQIVIKGSIQDQKAHPTRRQLTMDLITQILTDPTILKKSINQQVTIERIQTIINEVQTKLDSQINKKLTKNTKYNLSLVLPEFTTYIRYSPNGPISIFLKNQYGITESCYALPFMFEETNRSLRLSESYIPIDYVNDLNRENIWVSQIALQYLAPVRAFFKFKSSKEQFKSSLSNILEAADSIQEHQCCIRIEQVVNNYVKRTFAIVNIVDVPIMIKNKPTCSYHEVVVNPLNRLYFDIDSKHLIQSDDIRSCINTLLKIVLGKYAKYTIMIVNANNPAIPKYSYHVVINVACDKNFNLFIAKVLNNNLQVLNKEWKDIVDLGVYNNKSSLRLPNTVKIGKNNQIEDRKFTLNPQHQPFTEFVISNLNNCDIVIKDNILFDNRLPIDLEQNTSQFEESDIQKVTDTIEQPNIKWKIELHGSILRMQASHSYKCIVCNGKHDSDGMFALKRIDSISINCFSNSTRHQQSHMAIIIKLDTIETQNPLQEMSVSAQMLQKAIQRTNESSFKQIADTYMNSQFVHFDIKSPSTFVISNMGSGKSTELKQIINSTQYLNKSIICISFRKTFTYEFAQRYQLDNYMDINGTISLKRNRRVIIQIDSLFRLQKNSTPDILIVDEIESILEKMHSSNNNTEIMQQFLNIYKTAGKVVVMDGLIEKRTIEYLNFIRNTDISHVFYNDYKHRLGYKMVLIPFTSGDWSYVIGLFEKALKEGKSVYGMITQKKLGNYICDHLVKLGYKAIFYNGDDTKVTKNSEGDDVYQCDLKKEHFNNINKQWIKYDVVLHNSAVTAGVSFDEDYFDVQINIFQSQTCSSLSFVQGSHRVRHLKDKLVYTFVETQYGDIAYSPNDVTNMIFKYCENEVEQLSFNLEESRQMEAWLVSRKRTSNRFRLQLFIKYLKDMGYEIIQEGYPEDHKSQKLEPDEQLAKQISSVEISINDRELYDDQKRDAIIKQQSEASNKYHYMLQKLQLAESYVIMDFINNLNTNQIVILLKQRYIQDQRICINAILRNTETCQGFFWQQQTPNWIINMQLRKRNLFDSDQFATYNIIDCLKKIVDQTLATQNEQDLEQVVKMITSNNILCVFLKGLYLIKKTMKPLNFINKVFTLICIKVVISNTNQIIIESLPIDKMIKYTE